LCSAQLCPRLAQHLFGFAHLAVISMVVSAFSVVFAIGLLRRFLYPILDPLVFVSNTFDTHNLSINGLWFTRLLWFELEPWFEQSNVFASTPCLTQTAVLHKNCVIHKHNVLHKNHILMFLLGLCKCCLRLAG